jgi:hypothetical protein
VNWHIRREVQEGFNSAKAKRMINFQLTAEGSLRHTAVRIEQSYGQAHRQAYVKSRNLGPRKFRGLIVSAELQRCSMNGSLDKP